MVKTIFMVLAAFLFFIGIAGSQNYRYVNTIFPSAMKTTGIIYGTAAFLNSPFINESSTTTGNLVLDLYQPLNDTLTKRPAIIFAHSGGFVTGSRTVDDMKAFCDTFARKGYVTVTIDYRQGLEIVDNPDLHYIRAAYRGVQDGRTAVRFIHANAAAYGVDPDRVYFSGSSAGSFIGLNSVYMDTNELPSYVGPVTYTAFSASYSGPGLGDPDIGPNLGYSGTADGVMACWGGVGDTLTIGTNNPTPVFLIHGTADQTVPFNSGPPFGYGALSDVFGSHPISMRLADIGIPAKETYFVAGQDHEFYGTSNGTWVNGTGGNAYWDTIVRKATRFFWQLHKPTAAYSYTGTGLTADFTDLSQEATSWQWNFGDGGSGTDQNPVHTYAAPGTYNVRLYAGNDIQSWDTITHAVIVPYAAGITETIGASVRLYPVPASAYVTILSDHQLNPAGIGIYKLSGELMAPKMHQDGNKVTIELSGWAKGIYLIMIHSDSGILHRKLVVD
ncbi:MAG: PKD domain-containing protein [Bacteroidetes bacterium]|nr:PKD domain-containing protein [Bacteroidota bacterium]